jgi:two-component system sporulation sensor kinase A
MSQKGPDEGVKPEPLSVPSPPRVSGIKDLARSAKPEPDMLGRGEVPAGLLPFPIFAIDSAGTIVFANSECLDAFGFSAEDVGAGISPAQLVADEERLRMTECIRSVLCGAHISGEDYTAIRKDGSGFFISFSARPWMEGGEVSGAVGVFMDITLQKQEHARLGEATERYDALFNRSQECVIIADFSGNIIDANGTALSMLGYGRGELRSMHLAGLIQPDDGPDLLRVLGELVATGTQSDLKRFRMVTRDGRQVLMSSRSTLLHNEGGPYAIMCIARDVTEDHRMRQELEKSGLIRATAQVAAEAAHDIKNDLTVALLSIDAIRMRSQDPDVHMLAERAMQSLGEADKLAREMMLLSAPPMESPERVEVNRMIANIIMSITSSRKAEMPEIEIVRYFSGDDPGVMGDRSQLERAFHNILVNAVEAMEGGGTITVSTSLEPGREGGKIVRVRISDTGPGMSAEVQKSIFKPFYTTKKERGNGLGLAITWRMVQNHGGEIAVTSEPGKGAAFDVTLPSGD